ncbi:MAG: DUF2062 domain-containing protein [Thermodesulfobacteriota bacterium]
MHLDPLIKAPSWQRCVAFLRRHFVEPLAISRNPPWFDARGVAVGLFVGLGTPVGIHTVAVALMRLLFRFNFPVGLAFNWVCNPFNMFPLYYFYYWFGSVLLGKAPTMEFEVFRRLMDSVTDRTYFWEEFAGFLQLGQDLLLRWTVGALVVGVVSAVLGYLITYGVQARRCRREAEKSGMGYEEYVRGLEEPLSVSEDSQARAFASTPREGGYPECRRLKRLGDGCRRKSP